jgi:hypothetical protein
VNGWFDRLNLAPTERRWAIFGLCLVGLLLNHWLIWPFFAEWDVMVRERTKLEGQKQIFFKEVSKKSSYEKMLKELEGAGGQVMPEEQANRVQQGITAAASTNGVNLGRVSPQLASLRASTSKDTNFFDEQIVIVDLTAKEESFVNFLYALGSSDSMIRVRDMSRLRLDNSGQNLGASVTFVASFQKKPKPAAAAGSGGKATPVAPAGQKGASSTTGAKSPGGTKPAGSANSPGASPSSGSASSAKSKSSTNAAASSRVTGTNAPTQK